MKQRRRKKLAAAPKTTAGGKNQPQRLSLKEELPAIGRRCAALPVLDARTPEEILGYDENGLPT
jgi:antitoxin VapB